MPALRVWVVLAVVAASGCDQRLACGPSRCEVAQVCLAPADACVVGLETPPCRLGPCTDRIGRDGCWQHYFDGACIDLPAACEGVAGCICLDPAIMALVGPGARCVLVDERGWVVVDT